LCRIVFKKIISETRVALHSDFHLFCNALLIASISSEEIPYHVVSQLARCNNYERDDADLYWILAAGTAMMFFLSLLLKKNELRASGHVAVH